MRSGRKLCACAIIIAAAAGVALVPAAWAAQTTSAKAPASKSSAASERDRPAEWAVKLAKPGLPNLFQVSTNLYRGAQPTAEGMAQLKAMGIKTVINLRAGDTDAEKLTGAGLKSERFPMHAWHSDEADVIRFLRIVADTNNLPAFVHCQRGADRTGLMCAMYRLAVCGWSKREAIREMTQGGFGFNPLWKNLVNYLDRVDVEKVKRQAETGSK